MDWMDGKGKGAHHHVKDVDDPNETDHLLFDCHVVSVELIGWGGRMDWMDGKGKGAHHHVKDVDDPNVADRLVSERFFDDVALLFVSSSHHPGNPCLLFL